MCWALSAVWRGCLQMRQLAEMENSGLVALLVQDKCEDLGRMYSLFKRVHEGLALIRTMMCDHVKETGKQLVMVGAGTEC